MKRQHRETLLLLVFLATAPSAAYAQDDPACLRRTVVVNVTDRKGDVIPDLTEANFRTSFRGYRARLLGVERRSTPSRVVVLLDSSGSMGGGTKRTEPWWRFACSIAGNVIASAPEEALGGLLVFSKEIKDKIEPRQGRKAALEKLNSLAKDPKTSVRGQSAVWDAIAEGLRLLEPAREGDAIYVISDGEDNRSQIKLEALEDRLLASGARVFVFMPVTEPSAIRGFALSKLELAGFEGTERVAFHTGGYTVTWYYDDLPSEPKILGALQDASWKIQQQMSTFYRLEVELFEPLSKPRGWKLEVLDPRGKKRNDVEVLYPRKLMPCVTRGIEN